MATVTVKLWGGGGGGGTGGNGGGGGAGAYVTSSVTVNFNTSYTVTVAQGGQVGTGGTGYFSGGNGGGGGGGSSRAQYAGGDLIAAGGGGGASNITGAPSGNAAGASSTAGGNGGTGDTQGGGGGGAGANGSNNSGGSGGGGAAGATTCTGTNGNGSNNSGGSSAGTSGNGANAGDGTGGTGSGGAAHGANGASGESGGGGNFTEAGGRPGAGGGSAAIGGPGLVIYSYPTGTLFATGGTITTSGGNTFHTFTSSGTFSSGPQVDTINLFESISVSENIAITTVTFRLLNVNDIVSHTENITTSTTTPTTANTNESASVLTSAYKWLTSTLLAAQQLFTLRPYIQCKILDDTIQPNQIFAGTIQPQTKGTFVQAPDGSLLGAGFGTGGITFYKAASFHAGTWDATTVLLSPGTDPTILSSGNNNRVVITCSDYINGSYHIDVFFFNNFTNTSANLNVVQYYSDDGGTTWNSRTTALSDMPGNVYNAGTKNLSLAAFKPRLINGTLNSGFFYLHPNGSTFASGYLGYEIMYRRWTGASYTAGTAWSQKNVDSKDWTLHSIDSYYYGGVDYIAFSGFRNVLESPNLTTPSYGIYITWFITMTDLEDTDLWASPCTVFKSHANSVVNQNSFTYPRAIVNGSLINLTFASSTVDSVAQSAQGSTSTVVTTLRSAMLCQSKDGFNYNYPTPFIFSDGTVFTNVALDASFVPNGIYYYLATGRVTSTEGKIWEYVQNNVLADVTNDVIEYKLADAAGQPSSINIRIANQNNQWVGSSPTNPGASAITGDRRIQLFQGFYNTNATPEVVPQNTYYIDDINQQTNVSENDVVITGRDFYKKLKVTITKFAFSWMGPFLYTDIFDGSTLANWLQINGSWTETVGTMTPLSAPATDSIVLLSGVPSVPYGSMMYVNVKRTVAGTSYVYAYYIDQDNWLRWSYTDSGGVWTVTRCIAGTSTNLDTGVFGLSASNYYPIIVRQYDYYKFNFMIGNGAIHGNDVQTFTSVNLYQNSTNGEFDCTSALTGITSTQWSVGFGCVNNLQPFQFFKYMQYNNSNSIADLVKALATKASIFSYDFQNTIVDYFHQTAQYTGTFTVINRILKIAAGNVIMNNVSANSVVNGEIAFSGYMTPVSVGTSYGFTTVFRAIAGVPVNTGYKWHVKVDGATGFVSSRFEIIVAGVTYFVPACAFDATSGPAALGSLNIDFTKTHLFRLVTIDGWMYAFIDNIMVNAWNDNNTTFAYYTTGFWGWGADSNTTLFIQNVKVPAFYKQIATFSLNPGDDIESAIEAIFKTVRGWFFSNQFGIFKAIFLLSTDPSTYTYNTQLYVQSTDTSDKEYVSQVTVYGSSVSATARDTSLISKGMIREAVFVDYQIKTQQEAQVRANNELIQANQYRSQYAPKQVINVGAEIFDAITVVNIGNNTTGVNATSRTYAQTMEFGGKADYYMQIQSGNL